MGPLKKTDSDIRREVTLESTTTQAVKTLDDLCKSFAEHLKEDKELREKISSAFGSIRLAAWIFGLLAPSMIFITSTIGLLIINDMKAQMLEIRERVARLENLHIGEKQNGK